MSCRPTQSELTRILAESEAKLEQSIRAALETSAWLAAIVEDSDDAILSKTLDGIIMTWNAGAEALFGYTAQEAIGKPVTLIIPDDRLYEEGDFLSQLQSGKRIRHFETRRKHKDGTLIDVSLTVSPVRNAAGQIFGASKIARDISAIKQSASQQALIIREMHHRIKNLFALTISLIAMSARASGTVKDFARDLTSRLHALSRAHALILPDWHKDVFVEDKTDLKSLIGEVLAPHDDKTGTRITTNGVSVPVGYHALPTLSLIFHELATNAAKHGALIADDGKLDISIRVGGGSASVQWLEFCGNQVIVAEPSTRGFGSSLEKAGFTNLGGTLARTWHASGLEILMTFPIDKISR